MSGQDVSAGDPRKTALMLALAYGVLGLTEVMNVLEGADLSGGDYERLAPVAVAMKDAVGAFADEFALDVRRRAVLELFAAVAGTGE